MFTALRPTLASVIPLALLVSAAAVESPQDLAAADLEFFEAKIRPLLIENCYECHSVGAERVRGGFLLDSKPGLLRGGDSGKALVPHVAAESRLINMVRHHPDFESMPPKTKLSEQQINDLITWIDQGAPDPRLIEPEYKDLNEGFDLEARKDWWSLQPVTNPTPPAVHEEMWPNNAYDKFILAALEEKNWAPAPDANRGSLLRRLSFDLTGLPPSPTELAAFVNDSSPEAYARQVDRLLASPHFGEKWARHWMDVTRYAETKAFEADYTMPFVYRYRDYLIRAFNADVPYNQFILEALAGDLLEHPRIDPQTGDNESIMGPGYLFLSDGQHGPPDIHEDEARIFARTIDVATKAFLGSTVACARCHDHKFDAITTADYYSLYGILRSSRLTYANAANPDRQQSPVDEIERAREQLEPLIYDAIKTHIDNAAAYIAARDVFLANGELQTALKTLRAEYPAKLNRTNKAEHEEKHDALTDEIVTNATPDHLDPFIFRNWINLALTSDKKTRWPELAVFQQSGKKAPTKPKPETVDQSTAFQALTSSLHQWRKEGHAFELKPEADRLLISQTGEQTTMGLMDSDLIAGHQGGRTSGVIRSPDFIIDGKTIHLQTKGRFATVRLIVRNYELAGQGPTTAILNHTVEGDHWQDVVIKTYLWEGQPAYLEIVQHGLLTRSRFPRESQPDFDENAYVAVRFISQPDWHDWWQSSEPTQRLQEVWQKGRDGHLDPVERGLMSALFGAGVVNADPSTSPQLAAALAQFRALGEQIPEPVYVRSLTDGDPKDEPVYIRGSHKNLSSEPNPRHFLDSFGGPAFKTSGSGRIEWGRSVAEPTNPLTTRVIVNRLWHHIFGQGLVSTVNDFGVMGAAPSHPELLDFIAHDLIRNDWSLKTLIRRMVLTRTYQMSTTPSVASLDEDPDNLLLQHMPIKRLDAEAVRDNILASSGSLNPKMFGPSVAAYVDNLPDSRAKPPISGPLDADNRRSVYMELRRNFMPTFLRAFDLPNATEPVGARHATNVPAQSLALLNDPFVHEQAKNWGQRMVDSTLSAEDRINQLHLVAFSRPATDEEFTWAHSVLETMAEAYGTSPESAEAWSDLCHLIFNRKEFIYLL